MLATFVIAGAFFVAFIAAAYFGMKQREEDAARELDEARRAEVQVGRAHDVTSDDVVLQLERRIDEEMREISYDLRAPERYGQAFQA